MSLDSLYANDPTLLKTLTDPLAHARSLLSKVIAGEEQNALTLYLVTASYVTERPLSAFLQGRSGLGKTHVLEGVTSLFPPSDLIKISRSTDKWLDYCENLLMHKILYFGQLRDMDKSESLQMLLTENGIATMTLERAGKTFAPTQKTTQGLFSVLSSTVEHYEPQMDTRVFTLTPDDSQEQTARIMALQQHQSAYPWEIIDVKEPTEELRKAVSWLRDLGVKDVVVPFAKLIKMPTHVTRARRDWQKLEGLTKSLAMLRQTQRDIIEVGGKKYVVAEWQDFLEVLNIAGGILHGTLTGLSERQQTVLSIVGEYFMGSEFSVSDVCERCRSKVGLGPTAMKRLLADLCRLDYVEQTRRGGGYSRQNLYRLLSDGHDKLGSVAYIPSEADMGDFVTEWRSLLGGAQWHRYEGLRLVPKDAVQVEVKVV
ncbi:MAG: hypothetical protein ABSA11_10470 [Candidatus Bathyarchaeia archaeon]